MSARVIHAKTTTFSAIRTRVMRMLWPACQRRTLVARSGRLAARHSRHRLPTEAGRRHSVHAGVPHRVHRRPAGRVGCHRQWTTSAVGGGGGGGRSEFMVVVGEPELRARSEGTDEFPGVNPCGVAVTPRQGDSKSAMKLSIGNGDPVAGDDATTRSPASTIRTWAVLPKRRCRGHDRRTILEGHAYPVRSADLDP